MRKVLAILLISLLSLQASWAAAASYCRHEQGTAARHFGHHEHHHDGQLAGKAGTTVADSPQAHITDAMQVTDAADAPDGISGLFAGADLDCSVCHVHALFGVPSNPTLSAPAASGVAAENRAPHSLSSVPQARPERPNWRAA